MSEVSEIEKLYSPSRWSKRLPSDIICQTHVELTTQYSEQATKSIPSSLSNRYGSGGREVFDIFGTDLDEGAPILVFIHGGYWQEQLFRHNNYSYISTILYKKKIKSIYIGYELCPQVTIQEIQENIEKAMKMVLEYARSTKAGGIHLSGHSAGADLVAYLSEHYISSLPDSDRLYFKSAFLLAGIYDLVPLLETSYNILLKFHYDEAVKSSALHEKMKNNTSTFFVVVAEYDSPAFVENGQKMHQHLKNLDLNSKFIMVNDVDHFDIVEKLIDETYELSKLIIDTILN